MTAIMRRELSAYFASPIGYIFLAVFYIFGGFYFTMTCLLSNSSDLSFTFNSMFTIVLILVPLLTMRLFSEDKKHKTDQALLTAPVSLLALVLGKFLAAVLVYLLSLAATIVYAMVIAVYAPPGWAHVMGNFIALLLMGMAFISIGLFVSSLTENQLIAAVGSFAIALTLIIIDSVAPTITVPWLRQVFMSIAFFSRYSAFTVGKLELSGVVFFLSICAVFLFLTVRVLDKRRWS
ncbi:MAG: ABC transporter permease [Oscillospiraceae bacterium]|nr:ABC transporter permease [Oscillospiraceae bacterium]